jgi:hypothetical protein
MGRLVINVATYLLFAITFWLVGLFAYLLTYMAACSVVRGCLSAAMATPEEAISAVVAGSVAMWLAVLMVGAIRRRYPARAFAAVSTGFTLLFAFWEALDWLTGKSGGGPDSINNAMRFTLAPAVGCAVAWLMVWHRGRVRESPADVF